MVTPVSKSTSVQIGSMAKYLPALAASPVVACEERRLPSTEHVHNAFDIVTPSTVAATGTLSSLARQQQPAPVTFMFSCSHGLLRKPIITSRNYSHSWMYDAPGDSDLDVPADSSNHLEAVPSCFAEMTVNESHAATSSSLTDAVESERRLVEAEPIPSDRLRSNSIASLYNPACCRICQCDANEPLISPCLCCGSVQWMHESCLIHWMKTSMKDSCEICHCHIEIRRRKKSFWKWKAPTQRPTPVLWVLVFITAIALNLASVIKDASRLCTSTPCIVFYAVGCVGVILGTLFLIYWSKRAKAFLGRWIEQNEDWCVSLPEKSREVRTDRTTEKSAKMTAFCSQLV